MSDVITDPLDAVYAVGSVHEARTAEAELRQDLEDNYEDMTPEQIREHEEALKELRGRFKTVGREHSQRVEKEGRAEERDRAKRQRQAEKQTRPGPQAPRSKARKPSRRSTAAGYGFSLLGRGRGRRYAEQTGLPSAARSTTELVMQAIGVMVGLSFLYLLLSNAQRAPAGGSAIEQIGGILIDATRRLIDPVDPLGKSSSSSSSARAGGSSRAAPRRRPGTGTRGPRGLVRGQRGPRGRAQQPRRNANQTLDDSLSVLP